MIKMEESEDSFELRDSESSWLETWWARGSNDTIGNSNREEPGRAGLMITSVKQRITEKRRKNRTTSVTVSHEVKNIEYDIMNIRCSGKNAKDFERAPSSFSSVPIHRRTPIPTLTVEEFVKEESVDKDTYSVTMSNCKSGLGLTMNISSSGDVVVGSLKALPNGETSPVQLSGMIQTGDSLVRINDTGLETLDFMQTTQAVKSIDRFGKTSIRLTFRYCADHQAPPTDYSFPSQNDTYHMDTDYGLLGGGLDPGSSLSRRVDRPLLGKGSMTMMDPSIEYEVD